MVRYKWFRIFASDSLPMVIRHIKKNRFHQNMESGYIYIEDEQPYPSFRFVWRSSFVSLGIDENGYAVKKTMNSLSEIVFAIFSADGKLWIRITDPPRALRELWNSLEKLLGFGFSVDPEVLSKDQQSAMLRQCEEYRLIGLRGTGALSAQHLVARVDMASKEGIYPENIDFLRNLNFSADQSSYEIFQADLKGQVTFASNGSIKISGALSPYILNLVQCQMGIVGK